MTAVRGFECPLHRPCFTRARAFPSYEAANEAVRHYHGLPDEKREEAAAALYERHVPLVRKTLARFCRRSSCYPGACLVEDLVGESFLAFRKALDAYEFSYGVDFIGYLSRRLYWSLEHEIRGAASEPQTRTAPPEVEAPSHQADEALTRVLAQTVLERLDAGDAELLVKAAGGWTHTELAADLGISAAAVRKRLERVRRRLGNR